jgi:hypothetical protein
MWTLTDKQLAMIKRAAALLPSHAQPALLRSVANVLAAVEHAPRDGDVTAADLIERPERTSADGNGVARYADGNGREPKPPCRDALRASGAHARIWPAFQTCIDVRVTSPDRQYWVENTGQFAFYYEPCRSEHSRTQLMFGSVLSGRWERDPPLAEGRH